MINPFCVSSKKNGFKDNVKLAHCVSPYKLKSLDIENSYKNTKI